jgi:hypothetical protein
MNNVQNSVHPSEGSAAVNPKKAYAPPTLSVFGQIAALTRSSGCSANNDSSTSCTPGQMNGAMVSDRRLKQDILLIGEHPSGFGLYLFHYKSAYRDECGHGRQFGVMAEEVEKVMPEAVTVRPDGYKAVRYDLLGIGGRMH